MAQVTGTAIAAVNRYANFDPAKPEKSPAEVFMLIGPGQQDKDGAMRSYWKDQGYTAVGQATITIDFMPHADITANAVAALRKQKTEVLAKAQAEATHIEGQIQSLLAITNEA